MENSGRSEDLYGERIDRCLYNGVMKLVGGVGVGIVCSAVLFKRKPWPLVLGAGVAAGSAISSCNYEFKYSKYLPPTGSSNINTLQHTSNPLADSFLVESVAPRKSYTASQSHGDATEDKNVEQYSNAFEQYGNIALEQYDNKSQQYNKAPALAVTQSKGNTAEGSNQYEIDTQNYEKATQEYGGSTAEQHQKVIISPRMNPPATPRQGTGLGSPAPMQYGKIISGYSRNVSTPLQHGSVPARQNSVPQQYSNVQAPQQYGSVPQQYSNVQAPHQYGSIPQQNSNAPAQNYSSIPQQYSNVPAQKFSSIPQQYSNVPAQQYSSVPQQYSNVPAQQHSSIPQQYSNVPAQQHCNAPQQYDFLNQEADGEAHEDQKQKKWGKGYLVSEEKQLTGAENEAVDDDSVTPSRKRVTLLSGADPELVVLPVLPPQQTESS